MPDSDKRFIPWQMLNRNIETMFNFDGHGHMNGIERLINLFIYFGLMRQMTNDNGNKTKIILNCNHVPYFQFRASCFMCSVILRQWTISFRMHIRFNQRWTFMNTIEMYDEWMRNDRIDRNWKLNSFAIHITFGLTWIGRIASFTNRFDRFCVLFLFIQFCRFILHLFKRLIQIGFVCWWKHSMNSSI